MRAETKKASTHPILPIILLHLYLPLLCRATHPHQAPLNCADLRILIDLFRGEFNNFHQNVLDKSNPSAMGKDYHFFIQRFHVPVRVLALQAGPEEEFCTETQQVYLDQYFNGMPFPRFQRIFNFILKDGHIIMETRKHRDENATESWDSWRQGTDQFEGLRASDLVFDPACNVRWIKIGPEHFQARTSGKNCVFDYRNTQDGTLQITINVRHASYTPTPVCGNCMVYLRTIVDLEKDKMTQDEHFISVKNGTIVSGTTTPYVYRRVSKIPAVSNRGNQCDQLRCFVCMMLEKIPKSEVRRLKLRRLKRPSCIPHKIRDLPALFRALFGQYLW